jgi:hypothetical protein
VASSRAKFAFTIPALSPDLICIYLIRSTSSFSDSLARSGPILPRRWSSLLVRPCECLTRFSELVGVWFSRLNWLVSSSLLFVDFTCLKSPVPGLGASCDRQQTLSSAVPNTPQKTLSGLSKSPHKAEEMSKQMKYIPGWTQKPHPRHVCDFWLMYKFEARHYISLHYSAFLSLIIHTLSPSNCKLKRIFYGRHLVRLTL